MGGFFDFGKTLIIIGLVIAIVGILLVMGGKIPWIGRLPGDLTIKGEKFTFYFPIATSILISVVLSLVFWFIGQKIKIPPVIGPGLDKKGMTGDLSYPSSIVPTLVPGPGFLFHWSLITRSPVTRAGASQPHKTSPTSCLDARLRL